jgi:hypothetical protein
MQNKTRQSGCGAPIKVEKKPAKLRQAGGR